ncbi:hypothetical protein ACC698_38285, partial [Rhizobium johnstonii]
AATFPDLTGLVHISGVDDAAVSVAYMRDSHRVLVNADDLLDNAGQLRALLQAGYTGPFRVLRGIDTADDDLGHILAGRLQRL